MPAISVIVPVYKVEQYLSRCLDSLLRQSFEDFELILVDDGSPDRSGIICDEFALKDQRIKVIHQKNGGASSARNHGLDWAFANSESEWICFVDSDDWVHPNYLESLYNAVQKSGCNLAVCTYAKTDGAEVLPSKNNFEFKKWRVDDYMLANRLMAIIPVCKIYKKEAFKNIRYPVGKICEDEFVTYKILFQNQELVATDEPLYAYYTNHDSVMSNALDCSLKHMVAYEALGEAIDYFIRIKNEKMIKLYLDILNCTFMADVKKSSSGKSEKERLYYQNAVNIFKRQSKKYRKYFISSGIDIREAYKIIYPLTIAKLKIAQDTGFKGSLNYLIRKVCKK